jgi:hypothetical protein
MATLSQSDQLTYAELAKRYPENVQNIVECELETNEMLTDLPVRETNNGDTDDGVYRESATAGEAVLPGEGVVAETTKTETRKDNTCIVKAYSEVDEDKVNRSSEPNKVRTDEARGIINGMGITQQHILVYGDRSANPRVVNGVATRRPKINAAGHLCISAGGTGSKCTSVYLSANGLQFNHLIYPKGSSSIGITREDLSKQKVSYTDGDGKIRNKVVYSEMFETAFGLVVEQKRGLIRLANITDSVTDDDLIELIFLARSYMPKGAGSYSLFGNNYIKYRINRAARSRQQINTTWTDPWGKIITAVGDLRVRQVDEILSTEEAIA